MPWIEVDEPHARPPRLPPVRPGRGPRTLDRAIDLDGPWAELSDVEVAAEVAAEANADGTVEVAAEVDPGGPGAEWFDGVTELTIRDSVVHGLVAPTGGEEPVSISLHRAELHGADLSRARIAAARSTRLVGCKLTGTDLSGARLDDVAFEGCTLRYTNLRMARLSRVAFLGCTLEEVDAYELAAEDVDVAGSALREVNLDRLRATRVDLRAATELTLVAAGRLDGCLVAEHQVPALAWSLALAAGLDIERPDDP